jgi:adenosylmethionine-8-amino-7-oxononanoate aminotransferase
MAKQAATLMNHDLSSGTTKPAILLAERLSQLTPGDLTRTFFCSSGSEAAEAALKMSLMYHHLAGDEARTRILSLADGYHGATVAAAHLTSLPLTSHDAGPARRSEFVKLPSPRRAGTVGVAMTASERQGYEEEIARRVVAVGPERIAALFVEPILGVGGVIVVPDQTMTFLRLLSTEHGILLVADEVLTGCGRTGAMFACEHSGVVPDVMLNGKGLSGGYCSLASLTTTDAVYRRFGKDPQLGGFRHGHTSSGHATACAAALAVLDVIEDLHLVERAKVLGRSLSDQLRSSLACHQEVVDVRGRGLLIGLECRDSAAAKRLAAVARTKGVIVRAQGPVVSVAPPLTLEEAEAEMIVRVLADSVHGA